MLAAHRDQENLVRSQQVPTKQQPKTPGARYPKTPSRFGDENAAAGFTAKASIGGAKLGGHDKNTMKGSGGRQALMTPMGNPSRAVLGNKTTNAKARAGQTGGVKGIVKELEKTQAKPTTTQRPKQRGADVAPIKFEVKQDKQKSQEEEEPEYAPPTVEPLPYESDVVPRGLTLEGLKDENLMKGYYDYYHNPVDANGVSRKDKQLEDEMEELLERATERNERELRDLDWTVRKDDMPAKSHTAKPPPQKMSSTLKGTQKNLGTITSRRAAAALAQPAGTKAKPMVKPTTTSAPARRPLSSLLQGTRTAKQKVPAARDPLSSAPGELASRTTLGYNKGKSASSMLHPRRNETTLPIRSGTGSSGGSGGSGDDTITPARARRALSQTPAPVESPQRPQFLSIFDGDNDDEDLPAQITPQHLLEDEDEDFELRLDI